LAWDEVSVRERGDLAIAIGRQTHEVTFQGQPAAGAFRATQVAIRSDGDWQLIGLHLSPIAQLPGGTA
jgi:ketosteroid isomerase-like protein